MESGVRLYDTLIDLITAASPDEGMTVQTQGYYEPFDGGAAVYHITKIKPERHCERLNDGMFAVLINKDVITPRMFGAIGDGTHDDTQAVQNAIDYAFAHKTSLVFPTGTVYAVSTVKVKHGNQSLDFCGCTLKALSEGTVLDIVPEEYDTRAPNGYIKNLTIDMNGVAAEGLRVANCWRKVFDNIGLNNPGSGSIGLHVLGNNSCAGNLFSNFRGIGRNVPGAVYMVIDAGDNTFSNIDYSGYQYGIDINRFSVLSNIHGYIADPLIYPGSYFVKIQSHAQISNIYPDTQQYALIANGNNASVCISNLILVFNTEKILDDVREQYPAYVIQTSHHFKTRNLVINGLQMNTDIYDNEHFITLKTAPVQVNGFVVNTNLKGFRMARPGVSAFGKNAACSFLSAGFGEDPILYTEGYHDVITARVFVAENDALCMWNVSQRFTPQVGVYPAVLQNADGGETFAVARVQRSGDEYIVCVNHSLSSGEMLYLDLPVYDHPGYMFEALDE